MIGGINYASSQIASIYNAGSQQLAATLTKIASGKRFQNASEDLIGFTRAAQLNSEINGYSMVKQNLTEAKVITDAAIQVGSGVYKDLLEMKNLAQKYIDEKAGANDTDKLAEYKAEFTTLKKSVVSALDNAYADGVQITTASSSLKTVDLDPEGNGTLDINFSAVPVSATIDGLDITTMANTTAVDTELTNSLTYLSEAKQFGSIIDNQLNLSNVIINSKEAVKSLITDIDEAEEMSNALDQSIRQQAAISMLAQANVSRQSVMKLYM